jgi:membrane protein DedA with SNARE-associated domain
MLLYVPVFLFAIVEGEVYYIAMCAAAATGKLNWIGVMVAGALGGATGDQLWFYVLRGRMHWLDRYPRLRSRRDAIVGRIRENQDLIILASRFLPGLRVAIPLACAYADVRPLRFSVLNLVSAMAWAGAIMLMVARLGPAALSAVGLRGWWGPVVAALLVLAFIRWLARARL